MSKSKSENVRLSEEILRGKFLDPFETLKLIRRLKWERAFEHARKLLALLRKSQVLEARLTRLRNPSAQSSDSTARQDSAPRTDDTDWAMKIATASNLQLRLAQEQSLCTYKDSNLPLSFRLERALDILREVEDLSTSTNQETLGQAGAIYKRMWEVSGQKQKLESALFYYLRGYEQGITSDYGYTAINAAFILDMLAHLEETEAGQAGQLSETTSQRHREADNIREELISAIEPLLPADISITDWWAVVTVAEAYFGLRRYDKAGSLLEKAAALPNISDWEYESTARQLSTLARLHTSAPDSTTIPTNSEAFQVLKIFLKEKIAGIQTTLAGKVGLALSGGGFRAALFHIGVLAKLAELDMLRNIEVLSCVSAGSVIGAHYYLEVRALLQQKKDAEITREDYIAIVQRIERDFLAGVQRNLRTRMGAEWWTNVKTVLRPNYSRTERIGELLEQEIYSRVQDGGGDKPRWLNELNVCPPGEDPQTFTPASGNWRRAAKVPVLIINATTLNTGHNWQFTTEWMGEPFNSINPEIDRNTRLMGLYYEDAPEAYRKFSLGRAVAASLCPPWLFEPIVLDNLYPGTTVRLVDGIVHNIHGTTALLEQDCNVILVSDATLQMTSERNPSPGLLSVPNRAVRISIDRQRANHYEDLKAKQRSSLLRGLMFLHLRKDLAVETLLPLEGSSGSQQEQQTVSTLSSELTSYGVRKDVQELLASIRTDLDAFSDTEAYALMLSGYLMTGSEFGINVRGYPAAEGERPAWSFLVIEEPMKRVGNPNFIKLLEAAGSPVLKLWVLSPKLRLFTSAIAATVFPLAALFISFYLASRLYPAASIQSSSRGGISYLLLSLLILFLITYLPWLLLRRTKTPSQIFLGVMMSLFGWLAARLYLHVLDPIYLAKGRIKSWYNVAGARGTDSFAETGTGDGSRFVRSVRSLSEKLSPSGTVGSINKLIDHANSVEAVAELFKSSGYKVTHYPRDAELNPLQLNLDLHASRDNYQVIASVRTKSDSPADWMVASELSTACSVLAARSPGAMSLQRVKALLVLVDVQADRQLKEFIENAGAGNVRIELAELTSGQVERILVGTTSGDRALEEIKQRLTVFSGPGQEVAVASQAVVSEGGAHE
jgi:predicted acylesterase/phospholipase RssA